MVYRSNSPRETRQAGARVAAASSRGDCLGLIGGLGTGKTEFVRGFVDYFSPEALVRSPSFTLVNRYETPAFPIYHCDFYRLKSAEELTGIGWEDFLDGSGICLVEWADMFRDCLPENAQLIIFQEGSHEYGRVIEIPGGIPFA